MLSSREKIKESGELLFPIPPAVNVAEIIVPEVQQTAFGVIDVKLTEPPAAKDSAAIMKKLRRKNVWILLRRTQKDEVAPCQRLA